MRTLANRVLFTGDSNYLFATPSIYRPGAGPFTAKIVREHIRLLAESGVDTYVLNPNAQRAFYPSKSIPRMTENYRRDDRESVHRFAKSMAPFSPPEVVSNYENLLMTWLNAMLDLEEAGVDWLRVSIEACREYGLSTWVSVRMNDVHGSFDPECMLMNCPLYGEARYRLRGTVPEIPDETNSYHSGLNYECREVRDFMFAQIRELVEDYEFTGLELDWLRNPLCCEPIASAQTIAMMTGWIGEVRALTRAKAEQTGHAYPLGMRTPGDFGAMRAIGLDIVGLVKDGLLDFVCPSNFWQTTWDMPYDRLRRELGDAVVLYGVIEDAPNWLMCAGEDTGGEDLPLCSWGTSTRLLSASAPLLRGNAAGKLALGAEGIEFFNFFATDSDLWNNDEHPPTLADYAAIHGIAQLETLRGQPKGYTFSTPFGACQIPYWESPEQLPVILEPRWRRAFRLPMCAETPGMELSIQLVVEEHAALPPLGVSVNGSWPSYQAAPTEWLLFPVLKCVRHIPEHRALNYRFPAELIHEGWNEIVIYNGSPQRADGQQRREHAIVLASIEVAVVPVGYAVTRGEK